MDKLCLVTFLLIECNECAPEGVEIRDKSSHSTTIIRARGILKGYPTINCRWHLHIALPGSVLETFYLSHHIRNIIHARTTKQGKQPTRLLASCYLFKPLCLAAEDWTNRIRKSASLASLIAVAAEFSGIDEGREREPCPQ